MIPAGPSVNVNPSSIFVIVPLETPLLLVTVMLLLTVAVPAVSVTL